MGTDHHIIQDANREWHSKTEEEETEKLGLIYDSVADQQRAAFEQNSRRYNLRAKERAFKTNDLVYVKNMIQSSAADKITKKLAPMRKLAYIVEKVGNDMYKLRDAQGKDLGIHHANQIYTQ